MSEKGTVLVTGWPLMPSAEALLRSAGFSIEVTKPAPTETDLVAFIRSVEPVAIAVRTGVISKACLDAAPGLKVIANHGAGYDDIDVDEATERGIAVFAARGRNAISVAEHVFALLLAVRKRVLLHHDIVRSGGWRQGKPDTGELYGLTMGIIGLGAIGERTAVLADAFGMKVIGFDPGRMLAWPDTIAQAEDLDDLLASCDVVSLHVPFVEATRHLIDAKAIAKMKQGAILINAARGGVVDEAALVDAIESEKLSGAGLDTFEEEPLGAASPVCGSDRIVLSPHIAGVTPESTERMSLACAENIIGFLEDEVMGGDMVNFDALAGSGK